MKKVSTTMALVALMGMTACSDMNTTQQRTLSGGAMGAAGGAIGGALTGCVYCGALIGGAVGAGGGYLYDQVKKGNM